MLVVAVALMISPIVAQVYQPHISAVIPSVARETVRPLTLPFSSKEQSVAAIGTTQLDTLNSLYIRSLNGEWTMQQLPVGTPITDVDALENSFEKQTTAVPQKTQYANTLLVYRRAMSVPFAWVGRSVFLRLSRVSGGCYVYVNGQRVGYTSDSRVDAEFDVTQYVNEGRNDIKLVVYSEHSSSDMENYTDVAQASLDGDITLFSQPRLRIRDIETQSYCDPATGDGVVLMGIIMNTNMLNARTVTVLYELADQSGKVVSRDKRELSLEMKGEDTVEFYTRVPNVKMWSSESPNLYTLTVRTFFEGRYPEYVSCDLGFRKVELTDKGLEINGKKIVIRSVMYNPEGKSIAQIQEDIIKLKSYEVNTLVIERYEPSDWFFTICDRLGMYVFNRANINTTKSGTSPAIGGSLANNISWVDAYIERAQDAYLSSHRYASAIGFILGDGGGNGYALQEAYLATKKLSSDRPVICLQAQGEWNSDMTPADISSGSRDRLLIGELMHWQSDIPTLFAASYNGNGVLTVTNMNNFADMSDFDLNYKIMVKNRVANQGTIPVMLSPGASANITLPVKRYPKSYMLDVAIVRKRGGNEVFAQQFD